MEQPKLGQLIPIDEHPGRDAVHVAIVPFIAVETLEPGQHVGIATGTYNQAGPEDGVNELIGIVDPFLKEPVKRGQQFYCCLYPGTATGLRHVYRHPTLDAVRSNFTPKQREPDPTAVEWLTSFARRIGISYDEAIEAGKKYVKDGTYTETHLFDGENAIAEDSTRREFWGNWSKVTGLNGYDPSRQDGRLFVCDC